MFVFNIVYCIYYILVWSCMILYDIDDCMYGIRFMIRAISYVHICVIYDLYDPDVSIGTMHALKYR